MLPKNSGERAAVKPIHEWDDKEILALIGREESMHLEFKSGAIEDSKFADTVTKYVSAFANSEGGLLVVGVEEGKGAGKPNVAIRFSGVDSAKWPSTRLQDTVEGNVHPYLPGIRYRRWPIPDDFEQRILLFIQVPKGTTAYQASDRFYYGRSEWKAQPLPDHEIRLRMDRPRQKQARVVAAVRQSGSAEAASLANLRRLQADIRSTSDGTSDPEFRKIIEDGLRGMGTGPGGLVSTSYLKRRRFPDEYCIEVALENPGELSLREFEADVYVTCDEPGYLFENEMAGSHLREFGLFLDEAGNVVEEGTLRACHELRFRGDAKTCLGRRRDPAKLFPGEKIALTSFWVSIFSGGRFADAKVRVRWSVFLDDAAPACGVLELSDPVDERPE